jgi:hypothetical protein
MRDAGARNPPMNGCTGHCIAMARRYLHVSEYHHPDAMSGMRCATNRSLPRGGRAWATCLRCARTPSGLLREEPV